MVLTSNIVIVIGPTPPGTGVIADATAETPAKSTSPHNLPASLRFMPTSMITAPGLTMSAVTVLRRPTAATSTSACRVCDARSAVALWQIVTVAFACSSSNAIGLPTVLLRPMTTACLPRSSMPVLSMSLMQPYGVQGRKPARPLASSPALRTEKPSTSLLVAMVSMTRCALMCLGSGICTRMPCTEGSALSAPMRSSNSASGRVASYFSNRECSPASRHALTLLRT